MPLRPVLTIAAAVFSAIPCATLPARAASFACDAAQAPDEVAVCAHRPLNDADVEMATRFGILAAMLPMGGNAKLRQDQEDWLAERRACGGDVVCLTAAYEARLQTLRAVFSEFAKQGPL